LVRDLAPELDKRARMMRSAALAAAGLALVWHALQYGFITDDAYISFVFSRNLAEHGQLVFNPGGDPVEGYTNFLWTALLGALLWLGLPPQVMSIALGIAFALGTLVVAYRLSAHLAGKPSPWDALAPALLGLSAGFACWSAGGLETQLFTFLVALALYLYVRGNREPRALLALGPVLALAAMTRPEGLLVVGVLGLHRLVCNLAGSRRLVRHRAELGCVALFVALWAPWFLWRWWYYGYPLPNTYYVKAAGEPPPGYAEQLWSNGLYYVWQWARQSGALVASPLVALGLLWFRGRSDRLVFGTVAAALGVAYLAYTARVGGDFMGLHRFVMPVFFLVAMGAALGLRALVEAIGPLRARPAACAALALALVATHGVSQAALTARSMTWGNWASDRGIDTPAFLYVYTRDRKAIGKHMRSCFRDDDFSIVGGAGAKPYYGRMRGIDVFGLVSERIAQEVPPTNPRAGHNKWAPNALLLEHDPEFVFSCYSLHADPSRPRLNCQPGFWLRNGYEQVTLHIPGLVQQGEYYTFFVRADRLESFECPGRIE
jgi:arabinofuranosyltransferase